MENPLIVAVESIQQVMRLLHQRLFTAGDILTLTSRSRHFLIDSIDYLLLNNWRVYQMDGYLQQQQQQQQQQQRQQEEVEEEERETFHLGCVLCK